MLSSWPVETLSHHGQSGEHRVGNLLSCVESLIFAVESASCRGMLHV